MFLENDPFARARTKLVASLRHSGITDPAVLRGFEQIPRHLFVSEAFNYRAYEDRSLPIGFGQTISAPSTVAQMLQSLKLKHTDSVLEIGSGSGYQTALLSSICRQVTATERITELYQRSRELLLFRFGLKNVILYCNTEFYTLQKKFDAIIFACGAESLPDGILSCLNPGGRLIIPVGRGKGQSLKLYTLCEGGGIIVHEVGAADFVPYID